MDDAACVPESNQPLTRHTSVAGTPPEEVLRSDDVPVTGGTADITLPPFGLTVLTDTPLGASTPGRW